MDSRPGGMGLVYWQRRGLRRAKSGVGAWTVIAAGCALVGAVLLGAQAAGWLHWTGPWAMAPAGLMLLAVSAQLPALVRAVLTWLAG